MLMFVLGQLALWSVVLLHVLTAVMLYTRHGIFWAIVGVIFPVGSEIYMVVRTWSEVGFLNGYIIAVCGVIALNILSALLPAIFGGIVVLMEKLFTKESAT